jgi:hypothetical protein
MADIDALFKAARAGLIDEVTAMLDAGLSPDATQEGAPLILRAAEARKDEIVKLLLERGVGLDSESELGTNLLCMAVSGGLPWLVERCLAAGQRIDRTRRDGKHLFRFSMARWFVMWPFARKPEDLAGMGECLTLLSRAGHNLDASVFDSPSADRTATLVGRAVWARSKTALDLLLEIGCSVDAGDLRPAEVAAMTSAAPATWERLAEAGLDDESVARAIAAARAARSAEALAQILEHLPIGRAEVVAINAALEELKPKLTPEQELRDAVLEEDVSRCEALLDAGARPDAEVDLEEEGDGSRTTPLALAEAQSSGEVLELFESRGFVSAAERRLLADGIPVRQYTEAPGFAGKAFGLIVAGTVRGEVAPEHWTRYRDLAARWSASSNLRLVAVPSGADIAHASSAGAVAMVVGLEVASASADDIAGMVPRTVLQPAESIASGVPVGFWKELRALDGELGVELVVTRTEEEDDAFDPDALDDEAYEAYQAAQAERAALPGLYLVCTGPLPYTHLVHGIPAGPVTARARDLPLYTGQDNEQKPHRLGVAGVRLSFVQMESPELRRIDLTTPHMAEQMAEFDGGELYLIAKYD